MKATLKLNKDGRFKVENVDRISYLYFPLTNEKSLKSAITPKLGGDAKVDQNSFILTPSTNEDFHNSFLNRNVYFLVNHSYTWSITGNTPYQMIEKDKVDMEADFLIHKIIRSNSAFACEIESFVPYDDTYRELHKITFKNISSEPLTLKPVVSVPLFARSADNIRDHRHVTSLLNRLTIHENGMINQPTFSFDERGHVVNQNRYGVFVHSNPESKVLRYWPILEEFIGEGNTLLDPEVVSKEIPNSYKVGVVVSGYEMTGGFEFEALTLKSGETLELYLQIVIAQTDEEMLELHSELTSNDYLRLKNQTLLNWKEKLGHLEFSFSDEQLNGWLKWVTLQPILRRIYGCSFLPHHDYGRGGRGWRDLWQDSLALILMEPEEVRHLLFNNFLGVRIDGSNATIIGDAPGQFLADRNHIARVWMDHGSWPFITTKLYLDKSGDYAFLFEHQKYFSDQFSHYTKMVDNRHIDTEHIQKTESGAFYSGTILEHLIIQNLIPFFNVGNHNNIRIEGADWNDALDMASKKGESVAFTSLYASNLIEIGHLLTALHQKGIETIELLSELDILLGELDFEDVHAKQSLLKRYFDSVYPLVKGDKTSHDVAKLSRKLIEYGQMLLEHVRANEWMENEKEGWFNGYYDGDGNRLENLENHLMTLTGQVFAIYGGAATDKQIEKIIESADRHLFDESVGGYRLNTDFKVLKPNMGRLFGFAYGHKENGSMFSHMAVMYANALYKRGFVHAGHRVLDTLYKHSSDIDKSKIYPGIPEYVDARGRGMYHYLTGSASWLILTEVSEVFGIKSDLGRLILEPKLLESQFDSNGVASIKTLVNGKTTTIRYHNPERLDYPDYRIDTIKANDLNIKFDWLENKAYIADVLDHKTIDVYLGNR